MIEVACGCPTPQHVTESNVGTRFRCAQCSTDIQLISGEALPNGTAAGDFDTRLTVIAGPGLAGLILPIGGNADVVIGKRPDCNVVLPGALVSRAHCKLARIAFGPSRWKLIDNHSTNGTFVNRQRIAEHELQDGDVLHIGEYQLEFGHSQVLEESVFSPDAIDELELDFAPAPAHEIELAPMPARVIAQSPSPGVGFDAPAVGGGACPSCEKLLPKSSKICISCGINIVTGRPVLTSQGIDEDALYESARQWIRLVSLLVWVTPMPIPIRSAAFGTRKPYAIWSIAIATVLASVTFFIAQNTGETGSGRPAAELMLWSPWSHQRVVEFDPQKIHAIAVRLTPKERGELRQEFDDPSGQLSDEELVRNVADAVAAEASLRGGEFHWYQLITHAFLHDTSSIYNFAIHLAGNMVFMLVFGTRVNALIGNIATALLYPVLAICAATAYLLSLGDSPSGPMLGASGAIMGLAGMYLILFPAHRVFCAMWISIWLRFRRIFGCKIFQLRGFWILLIYFAYDLVMNYASSAFGLAGGVAHWAHIGGFLTGMILGLGVLFSRIFNTHGGDVLSVTLGKRAWPLIGKPSRWHAPAPVLPRAVSLSYA